MANTPTRTIDTDQLGQEARSTGAEMGAASLAGVEGIGTLQIVRNRNGEVLEKRGSWRLAAHADDPEARLPEKIRSAADSGEPLTFDGPVDDPDGPERRETHEVRVTWIGRYPFDRSDDGADDDTDDDATEQAFVNFVPVDSDPRNVVGV